MRLTLRTLLAFMDDILDPDDHEQLSHKIETSDFATELIHRSRDTVRRLRLGALDLLEPEEVIEDSSWVDPNTVAEYLDNTLAVENVAEYERVCLESDLNLAEVASCHHILTMVLGEPAEVDEKVRRRLYGLPERSAGSHQLRIERAHGESDQAKESYQQEVPLPPGPATETRRTADVSRSVETGVPDYLKEAARSRRRNWRWLLATAALVCVIGYFAWDALIPPKLPSELAGTDPAALIPEVKISGMNNLAGDGLVGDDGQGEAPVAEAPKAAGGGHAAGAQATAERSDSEAPPFVPATAPSTTNSSGQATSEAPPFSPSGFLSGNQGGEPQELATEGEPGAVESDPSAGPVPVPGEEAVASSSADLLPEGSSTSTDGASMEGGDVESVLAASDEGTMEPEMPAGSGDLTLTGDASFLSGERAVSAETAASVEGGTAELVQVPADASSLRAGSTAGSEPVEGGAMSTAMRPTQEGSEAPVTHSPGNEAESSGAASDISAREAEETGPIQLGNYLGNNDVLLRFDPQQEAWVRMPPRSSLFTGERLLTLPKFRTQVVLAGLNLSLSGGTQIFLPTDVAFLGNDTGFSGGRGVEAGHDDLLLEMVYGRMLWSAGLNGSGVVLKMGDLVCWLQMGGSAGLAVEVNRQFVPGRDAEEEPAPIVATWYLTSGKLQLSVLDGTNPGPARTIEAPATWSFMDGVIGMPQLIDELPAWIDREPVTQTERRALTVLDDELVLDKPVGIRLLELNDRRQREVRTLAAQCSLYVGEFEPFIKALNDDQQKAAWKTLIDMLRQAIALSPDAASQLREAFVMRRGEAAADDLMQMVRGYDKEAIGLTPEAVKSGAISKLIGWLDHDSLDYRVLAYFNLQEITGKSIGYRPESNAKQRQRGIRTWRKRLESGELLPVQ